MFHQRLEDHYDDLAHHYSRSGNTEKAVEYLHRAGEQAVQRSAYGEAIGHLTTALEFLKTLPHTPGRTQQELMLQIALGAPLMATKGYGVPEVERVYTRARELCQQLGETPQLFTVLRGLWLFYLVRAEYKTARETAEQFLSLAQRLQAPTFLLGAHEQMGYLLFWPAEWVSAREHSERALTFYDPQKHSTYVSLYESDLGTWALSHTALALWCLGYPEQALQKSREALTLTQELAHPFSLAWVLICAAWLHQYRQEPREAQGRAEAAIVLSHERGFQLWLAWGTILRGWALAEQGQEAGIVQMRQGLATYRTAGGQEVRSYFLALLAEACGKAGRVEEGMNTLAEALAIVDKNGERYYEAELYRLKGTLTLKQSEVRGPRSEVE